ncbi:MAG TPA: vitamin B12-dependent ribonucleotide reductase, partial [Pseudonocardiaceae bacterium]|nr:vitamin B12-dependent ribonucleotide reductase [Pseudonocardiaceae bacterium]
KTINMPESATVEDVESIYTQGWELGLKAVAIYRDNCKVGQPLSVSKRDNKTASASTAAAAVEYRPVRRRLPKSRTGLTTSFTVGGAEGYITANSYPGDGLGEVFLKISKQGSTLAGLMDAFSVAISVGLQYGVPLETYVSKFTNMRFEPAGLTDDPDVRMAQSIMDYIFRRLALDFLPAETRSALGIYSAAQRAQQVRTGSYDVPADDTAQLRGLPEPAVTAQPTPDVVHSSMELIEAKQGLYADAPLCFTCGVKMQPAGSCYLCASCGSTSGCS